VLYRPYQDADFPGLFAIEEACFAPQLRFERQYLRRLIASPQTRTWIAEEDRALAGFAIVHLSRHADQTVAYLETIEVDQRWRHRGVGGQLLARTEGSAQAAGAAMIWLHVDAENEQAIRLYQAHGYLRDGSKEHFYPNGHAAWIYRKSGLRVEGTSFYA
jgi:[ribosomal protein S18]-alanine N-acetyltransferase